MKVRRTHSRHSCKKIGSFKNVDFITISQALLVADYASLSRAARVLGVGQSVVSRRIQALENELGVSLFERHQGGVRLTVAGRRFVETMRVAISEIETAMTIAAAAGAGAEGMIRIGLCPDPLSSFLSDLLKEYHRNYAAVRLELLESTARDQVTKILDRTLDVAFVPEATLAPDCDMERLWSSRIVVALPEDHILAISKTADWVYLMEERFIFSSSVGSESLSDLTRDRFAEVGRRPELETYAICHETLLRLVALGSGVTLVNEPDDGACYPGVIFRPLHDEQDHLAYCAVWLPENDNPALRRFLSLARAKAAAHTPAPVQALAR